MSLFPLKNYHNHHIRAYKRWVKCSRLKKIWIQMKVEHELPSSIIFLWIRDTLMRNRRELRAAFVSMHNKNIDDHIQLYLHLHVQYCLYNIWYCVCKGLQHCKDTFILKIDVISEFWVFYMHEWSMIMSNISPISGSYIPHRLVR